MSTSIDELTAESGRLERSIARAKAQADAVRLLELRDESRLVEAKLQRAQAERLAQEIGEAESERERLKALRDEQAALATETAAESERLAEEMAERQAQHAELMFRLASTDNSLLLSKQKIESKRRELAALVEGM